MKRKPIFLAFLLFTLLLFACSRQPLQYSFEDTTFYYGDREYDISAHGDVNGILSCAPVGKYIVIEGHVGPNNGIYCIFNTETQNFEQDIAGNHLIWHDDDITTAVYTFGNDICAYDGSVIATCDLAEDEYIYELEFVENNSRLKVTIQNVDGNVDLRTEIIDL